MKRIRSTILFLLAITMLIPTSCKEALFIDCETYDYYDCDTWEPSYGTLRIDLSINDKNQAIPIAVYDGYFEDDNLLFRDTIYNSFVAYDMEVDNYYSVTALYNSDNGPLLAVDGDDIRKKATIKCDSTCWTVKDARLNLKLKE